MKRQHKEVLRAFIIGKLKEVECFELSDLAWSHDGSPFEFAEAFEHEVWRIEKLFNFPDPEDESLVDQS